MSSCRLISQERIHYAGQAATLARYQCPDAQEGDPWAPARLLETLGRGDERNGRVRSIAAYLARSGSRNLLPERIHAYVRDHISFRPERTELFVAPWILAASGVGDCDDSERLVRALASAANIQSRYVFATTQGSPTHVTVQLWDRGAWRWAEVTVPAHYDEHPLHALQRLGIARPDIDGDFVTMPPFPLMGSLAALSKHTMGQVDLTGFSLPSYIDGGDGSTFVQTLLDQTSGVVDDPKSALLLLLHESGLEPFADNGAAVGIFQLDPYDPSFTNMSRDAFKNLKAADQLQFAAAFWRRMAHSFHLFLPLSGRDLYWTNFLPATVVPAAPDDYVIATSDDRIVLPNGVSRSLPGVFTDNVGLAHGKEVITAGDMAQALQDGAHEHPKTFAYLSNLIDAQGGGGGGGGSSGLVALLLGIGAGVAYEILKRS